MSDEHTRDMLRFSLSNLETVIQSLQERVAHLENNQKIPFEAFRDACEEHLSVRVRESRHHEDPFLRILDIELVVSEYRLYDNDMVSGSIVHSFSIEIRDPVI